MKITDKTINKVFIMPKIEDKYLNRAKKSELKVLYSIFMNGANSDIKKICEQTEETSESVNAAIAFWRGCGVLTEDEDDVSTAPIEEHKSSSQSKSTEKDAQKKFKPHDSYSLSEISEIKERDASFGSLVSYFEKISGHLYNAAEQGIVLYLYDTLKIDFQVIMGVAQYCASMGKNSLRYIEKTVLNIVDSGVSTYEELEYYLEKQKKQSDFREQVRQIIGAKNRALTKAENAHISKWQNEYNCSEELVSYAYEKTIAKINKPQVAYMSKILDSWFEKELKTPEQVDEFFSAGKDSDTYTDSDGRLDFDLEDIFEKPDMS